MPFCQDKSHRGGDEARLGSSVPLKLVRLSCLSAGWSLLTDCWFLARSSVMLHLADLRSPREDYPCTIVSVLGLVMLQSSEHLLFGHLDGKTKSQAVVHGSSWNSIMMTFQNCFSTWGKFVIGRVFLGIEEEEGVLNVQLVQNFSICMGYKWSLKQFTLLFFERSMRNPVNELCICLWTCANEFCYQTVFSFLSLNTANN